MLDLIIKNGRLFDGGKDSRGEIGDIAVTDGKIVSVGGRITEEAKNVVDAEGLVVSPGFIDVHTHSEIYSFRDGRNIAKASQGVTTELTGQCGISAYPVFLENREKLTEYTRAVLGVLPEWPWNDYESYTKALTKKSFAVNQAGFIGQGSIRVNAMGFENRPASPAEMEKMETMMAAAMEQGAMGLSSGLAYAPGIFTDPAELLALAKVAAKKGGIYTSHIRSESSRLLEAVEEAIDVGRQTGVQVTISHLKAGGKANHGKVKNAVEMIEAAAKEGIAVFADSYPYDASSTTMTILMPDWTMDGGIDGLMAALTDTDKRARIYKELTEGAQGFENRLVTQGVDRLCVSSVETEKNRPFEGKSLKEGAAATGKDPATFLMDLLLDERGQVGVVSHAMSEEDIRASFASDRVCVCSDGLDVGSKNHPRLFGSFPRYLRRYADLSCTEGIAAAVNKITAHPADVYRLKNIGRLLPGYRADITVFNPDTVTDRATYANPRLLCEGIEHVFVTGTEIYNTSGSTGALPGRIIKRGK